MIIDQKQRIKHEPYEKIISQGYKGLFYVDVKDIINPLGMAFSKGANHPFTEAMIEYEHNNALDPSHSTMNHFYKTFCPSSLGDAIFKGTLQAHRLYNISPKTYQVPWLKTMPMGGFGDDLDETQGSHFLGPVSPLFLTREYNRLTAIYDSIKAHGFDVDIQTDTIRGYFLLSEGNYKFVIVGGNHRVAVLNALGVEKIPVELHPNRPALVSRDEAKDWPLVQAQTFSLQGAMLVFDSIFNRGNEKRSIREN